MKGYIRYKNLKLHPQTVLEVAVSDEGTARVVDSTAQAPEDVTQGHQETFLIKENLYGNEILMRKAFILIRIFCTISKVT